MLFDTHTNLMWYPDHLSDEFVETAWEAKRAKMKLSSDVYFARVPRAAAGILPATGACGSEIRASMKAPQFSLRELLLLMALVAMGLGWWIDHRRWVMPRVRISGTSWDIGETQPGCRGSKHCHVQNAGGVPVRITTVLADGTRHDDIIDVAGACSVPCDWVAADDPGSRTVLGRTQLFTSDPRHSSIELRVVGDVVKQKWQSYSVVPEVVIEHPASYRGIYSPPDAEPCAISE